MRNLTKYTILYVCVIGVLIGMLTNLAQAQTEADKATQIIEVEAVEIDQAELDRILAPIALYPDTLLSHILVASTYPLELVQAARWRNNHPDLSDQELQEKVAENGWDPSVQALVPFTDLLNNLSEDLDWLQQLGDAFLLNEDQVLSSVQNLRQKAKERGNLEDNEYIVVVEEEDDIIIEPVEKEIVYVPYYDTRVVYGPWWWNSHPPLYWHRPVNYYWHAGFYWSPRFYISPSFYFGGFHWHRRHVVVSHHYYRNPHIYHYNDHKRRVRVKEYQRWSHNPTHRRGVRYHQNTVAKVSRNNNRAKIVTRSVEVAKAPVSKRVSLSRPSSANRYSREVAKRTTQKLQRPVANTTQKPQRYSSVKRAESVPQSGTKRAQNNRAQPQNRATRQVKTQPYNRQSAPQRSVVKPQRQHSVPSSQPKVRNYPSSTQRSPAKSYRKPPSSNQSRDKQRRSNRKDN